ncbi:MAG TPA: RpiB/LacA/LacB family sugar-phosphate isomerase [Solirubrobacteraceae bacterium]|jgi:ribose 5-phosphate isomerase B|nr:RpiB/LacA/LacB family sugar-phosphate isomerase [Solirubrobacteraceae bacterium]
MRFSVSADELTGIAGALVGELERRGHEALMHGALAGGERHDWAWASEAVARDVADGRAQQGIVCCWTGTGASIAANKVAGVRAALCLDAPTAAGARRWNDANVLAISLRATSEAMLSEILDAWLAGEASSEEEDRANVAHLEAIGAATRPGALAQLSVRGARAAVDFYKQALGAVEVYRVGGTDEHEAIVSQLTVGATSFWVADESPEHLNFSPQSLGGGTVRMLLIVADPDGALARAVAGGAKQVRAVADEHGWRLGRIEDPFGHHWEIGRPLIAWPPSRAGFADGG